YGWKDTGAHRWFGGRDKTTIHEFDGAPFQQIADNEWQIPMGETTLIVRGDNVTVEAAHGTVFFEEKPRTSPEHPTMKPVALIERMVCNSTKKGDIVFDPFGGSGSTLIACEKTGRSARLLELDPKYCDVIVRRWQDYTGKAASLDGGKTFAEVEKKRGGKS
ncbi:MAG: site-specific DNA-methyltransferase, partial [Deltaproteobacteria bacterium]|nr:site-specific DNA-methyltransferase [Deltaproteobacteria bacterium]